LTQDLYPRKGAEFFVHATDQVLAVDAHHVMAVADFLEHAVELAA